jgi:hypothetical protein
MTIIMQNTGNASSLATTSEVPNPSAATFSPPPEGGLHDAAQPHTLQV